MVVPPLSALLANSAGEVVGDEGPLLSTVDVDEMKQKSVFDVSPWTFDEVGVQHFLPSVEALDVCATLETLGDLLPALAAVCHDSFGKLLVLLFGPMTFDFHVGATKRLLLLILRRTSLVQVWVQLLMPDQVLLCLLKVRKTDVVVKLVVDFEVLVVVRLMMHDVYIE